MSVRKLKSRGIGRLELLAWLNEFLETDYTKIEYLADGIAYCQIFDALYPGKLNLQQVNFQAKTEMEYERNFQFLTRALHTCDVRKDVPIRKLVSGVFQEHLDFLHWVHDHVHRTYPDAVRSYHGFDRRRQVLGGAQKKSTGNGNLVPGYSNSMKLQNHSYLEPFPNSNTEYQHYSESLISSETVKVEPIEAENVLHPSLECVRSSYGSTMQLNQAIGQVESAMHELEELEAANICKPIERSVSRLKQKANPSTNMKKRLTAKGNAMPFDITKLSQPMNNLISLLEAELCGRMQDLTTLETCISHLASKR